MSLQKDRLGQLARDVTARRDVEIAAAFTSDFALHDPNAGAWPRGHEGARKMLESFRGYAPDAVLEILDMVEEGDRVAVRWRVSGTREGARAEASIVAIYRFADGRIAEDRGVAARAAWP